MPFDTWTLDSDKSTEFSEALSATAAALAQDKLCLFPCDTIYGLIARPSPEATRRLVQTKGRPADKPFLLLCPPGSESGYDLSRYTSPLNSFQKEVLALNWPGAVTFVLPASDSLGDVHPFPTIAVRIPDPDSAVGRLLVASGPVWAPSANLSGEAYSPDIPRLAGRLAGQAPGDWLGTFVDLPSLTGSGQAPSTGGSKDAALPSTIADISRARDGAGIRILRPGAARLRLPAH